MRTSLVLALLVALASPSRAEEQQRFHYPLPPAAATVVRKAVPYTTSGGKDVVMDVYRPARMAARARLPVIVFVNTSADRSLREHPIYLGWGPAAAAHGFAAINPDAASDFDAGFDALFAYLRDHAAELRVDPERVVVYAASANVVFALPAVEDPERTAVKAAIMYYGTVDSVAFRADLPVLFVRAGLDRPGMNAGLDALVASAIRANAPVSVINYPAGHHGFEMVDDGDATRDVIDRTFEFARTSLEPRVQAALRAGVPAASAAGAMMCGDYATATRLYGAMLAAHPDDPRLRLSYGEALLAAGRIKDARAEFDRLKNAGLGPRDLGVPAARAAAADGDPDAAIAWLKTIPKRFILPETATDPAFESLRERADFQELFR